MLVRCRVNIATQQIDLTHSTLSYEAFLLSHGVMGDQTRPNHPTVLPLPAKPTAICNKWHHKMTLAIPIVILKWLISGCSP